MARITATDNDRDTSSFSNREGIVYVVGILEDLSAGWEPTTDPLPPIRYYASLQAADKTNLLVFWVGDDWLAANDMQDKGVNFRQRLVDPEREKLLRGLGVGPYFDLVGG